MSPELFKETDEDKAVRAKLWRSTVKEIMKYGQLYADAVVPGDPYSDEQRDITKFAKRKGYPVYVVRAAGERILSKSGKPIDDLSPIKKFKDKFEEFEGV